MALISLQDVKKFYGRQDVLRGASFQVNTGEKIGLIGANGAGKTTLMRIVLDQETADEGVVSKIKGLRLGHLPQDLMTFSGQSLLGLVMDTVEDLRAIETELSFLAQDIETEAGKDQPDEEILLDLTTRQGQLLTLFENLGGYTLEAEAKKILQGLGFTEKDFERPIEEFSGGWMMRAVLARLLLSGPDVLLLDEPTNHLDMESLIWLENYLQNSTSALVLVSHDRVFLNNVVKRIAEVERGRVNTYSGNYDRYLEEKEKRRATEAATYAAQQDRIKQAERFIEKNRVRASTARRAQSRMKMLEKMEKVEAPVHQAKTFKISLPEPARSPEILVDLAGVTKAYGKNVIYRDLDLMIRRNDRLAFLGANGQGKSTLLKLLAGTTDFSTGTRRVGDGVVIGYFAQFQLEELNPDRTVLEELDTVAGDLTPGRLRSVLGGFLFRGDDVFKKVAVLSGGEKSRLVLAKLMLIAPNLLLLDEPSNHLDIPGRDMLLHALNNYKGTICLISHDRHLINAIANKILVVGRGGVEVCPGNLDDYQNIWKKRLEEDRTPGQPAHGEQPEKKAATKTMTRAEREARKKAEARARQALADQRAPLVKEIEKLENLQEKLSARLEELSAALAAPETYQDQERSKALNLEYAQVKAEADQAVAAWEEAAIKLEEVEAGLTDQPD